MFRRILQSLGLCARETATVEVNNGPSPLNRLQRQSVMATVNIAALQAKRRGEPLR